VLKPGTYDITVYCEDDMQKYRVWRKNKLGTIRDRPAYYADPNVHVFDHFGWSPTLDGALTTPISCLMPKAVFESGLYQCAAAAEILSSMPAMITQTRETQAGRDGMDGDLYADADRVEAQTEDKFHRSRAAAALFERQKELYANYLAARNGGDGVEKVKSWDNEFAIPSDRQLVHQMPAKARGDLVALSNAIQDEKCAAMGVPRSIIANDGVKVRGNLEGQTENFHQTILHWRDALSRVLTKVYHAIYGMSDAKHVLTELTGLKRERKAAAGSNREATDNDTTSPTATVVKKRPPLLTERDLYTMHEENHVTVSFPIRTAVETKELIMMWAMGFIGYDTLSQEVLRASQFTAASLDQEKDPWTTEERKAFVIQLVKETTKLAGGGAQKKPKGESKPKKSKTK
jgi:hypothetical protein